MSAHIKVTLASDSALPKDAIVNTFAVNQGGDWWTDVPQRQAMMAAFVDLYNGTHAPAALPISSYLSGQLNVSVGACSIDVYEIPATPGPMGSPVWSEAWSLQEGPNVGALPGEVALVATLEAAGMPEAVEYGAGGTRPKSRHRGRVYFGPLNINALNTTAKVEGRPATAFMDAVRLGIVALQANIQTAVPTADLGIWSRADNVVREIDAVSVDNAFDIVRSRGLAATSRVRSLTPS